MGDCCFYGNQRLEDHQLSVRDLRENLPRLSIAILVVYKQTLEHVYMYMTVGELHDSVHYPDIEDWRTVRRISTEYPELTELYLNNDFGKEFGDWTLNIEAIYFITSGLI